MKAANARARGGHIGNARARLYGVLAFSRKSAILAEEAFDRTEIGHEKLGDHPRTNAGLQTPKNADRRSRPITCVYFSEPTGIRWQESVKEYT